MLHNFIRKNILLSEGQGIDHTLIICFFALTSLGFIMVTSATLDHAYETRGNSFYFIIKHSIYLVMGIFLSVIISRIRLSFYNDYSKIFLFLSLIISLIIFIPSFGKEVNGARRWLDLGFMTIQVSEVSRLFIMFWICSFISRSDINKVFNKCLFMILALSIIILAQRDFGSTALLIFTFFSLMLVAGLDLKKLLSYIMLALIAAIPLIIYQPYRLERVISF